MAYFTHHTLAAVTLITERGLSSICCHHKPALNYLHPEMNLISTKNQLNFQKDWNSVSVK